MVSRSLSSRQARVEARADHERRGRAQRNARLLGLLAVGFYLGFILLGAAIVTLVALRRRIWRWNSRAQATLAMTCIFVAGLLPTGYTLYLVDLL